MLPSLILVSGVLLFDERKGGTVMKIEFFFLVVAVSAGITFFLRALPFLAFRGERKMPEKLFILEKSCHQQLWLC